MKLRNKLILSCAALAAVATTAVSTTYAWYTSNEEVHANNITTTTKNAGDDLLMIADGLSRSGAGTTADPYTYSDVSDAALAWGTTITPTLMQDELVPLAYKQASVPTTANTTNIDLVRLEEYTITPASGTEGQEGYTPAVIGMQTGSTAVSNGYLRFVLYIKNGGASAKGLQMTIVNLQNTTTGGIKTKSILNPAANRGFMGLTGSEVNYTANALRVAAIDLEISNVTDGATGSAVLADEGAYDLKTANSALAFGDTITGSYNAHSYYNAIMEKQLNVADTYNQDTADFRSLGGASGVKLLVNVPAAATANNYLKLDFKVFLNGWDKACFDACQGQDFGFNIDFKTTTPNA